MSQLARLLPATLLFLAAPFAARAAAAPFQGSDNCATPTPIAGTGAFPFDNIAATAGVEGQTTLECLFYGQNGIGMDVWFLWTAPMDGRVLLSTCGQTQIDTKLAVYAGSTCPGPGASAIACNDDVTSSGIGNYTSFVEFDVLAGAQYLVQLGTYPLSSLGGQGSFSITYVGGVWCQYDDGTTDYASSVGTAGVPRATCWMYSVGAVGVATRVTAVSSAWGWTATGTPLPAGLTGEVAVFEDPNDDGDPSDAVVLAQAAAPMVGPHTDVLQTIPLPAPVIAQGRFFIAAWTVHTTGFPTPRDISGCNSRPGVGWLIGNEFGPINTANLNANTTPPFQAPNGQTYVFLLRATCEPGDIGTVVCAGDGVAPHTACPCGNSSPQADGAGCLNSFGVGGRLRASGVASLSADTVTITVGGLPASNVLFFQGTAQQNGGNGAPFGDGLRCAGGTTVRLKTYLATGASGGATSSYPQAGDQPLSVRGGVTAPGMRTYQAWYRNAAGFCTPDTFNLSNGLALTWVL